MKKPLEMFRLSSLLSMGALIVSEPAYAADMHEFRDLVSFAEVGQMAAEYERLLGLTEESCLELVRERVARFAQRFSPRHILRRAALLSRHSSHVSAFGTTR